VSRPETPSGVDEQSEGSTFLQGIEFITGEDPNLGSFLLTVGLVTCVFIALFQGALPSPVSHLLTAGVIIITVVSAGFAALLDSLGYFDGSTEPDVSADVSDDTRKRWVPATPVSAPLPPMINFDKELSELEARFDGELPDEFTPFIEDYLRLKKNTANRKTIASDLRADLNPVGAVLEDDTREYELYERISDELFRYIGDSAEHLTVTDVVARDTTDEARAIESMAGELATIEVTVGNEGEATDVDVVIEFYAGDEQVSTRTVSLGTVNPAASATVSTNVYVPEETDRVLTDARPVGEN
jgi:hypothetical protein